MVNIDMVAHTDPNQHPQEDWQVNLRSKNTLKVLYTDQYLEDIDNLSYIYFLSLDMILYKYDLDPEFQFPIHTQHNEYYQVLQAVVQTLVYRHMNKDSLQLQPQFYIISQSDPIPTLDLYF